MEVIALDGDDKALIEAVRKALAGAFTGDKVRAVDTLTDEQLTDALYLLIDVLERVEVAP